MVERPYRREEAPTAPADPGPEEVPAPESPTTDPGGPADPGPVEPERPRGPSPAPGVPLPPD